MAYMNSGIEMKTSQYDWRIIGFIILLLVAVCALVTIKLLFPDMTQEKLFSVLSSSSPAVNTASPQNVPSEKSAATASHPVIAVAEVPAKATPPAVEQVVKTETKVVNSVPAATDTHVTVETTETATTQHIAEEPRSASKAQIVCSAEDREAELCQ